MYALAVLLLAAAAGPARADTPDGATYAGSDAGRVSGIHPAQSPSQARVFLPIMRRDTPDFADGRFRARSVALGLLSSCAVDLDGALWCWGNNGRGALGVGSDDMNLRSPVPRRVTGFGEAVSSVASAGFGNSCAVTTSGRVWCWGKNRCGELGQGGEAGPCDERPLSLVPLPVHALTNPTNPVRAVTLGLYYACALKESGAVWCWGDMGRSHERHPTPEVVMGLESGVVSIVAGIYHTCALLTSGGVKCWGSFGFDSGFSNETPTSVPGWESGMRQLAAGAYHVCALRTDGTMECFGENGHGQLGRGSASTWPKLDPSPVLGLPAGVSAITAGGATSCAVIADGTLWCWGWNEGGQLGVGRRDMEPQPQPQRVQGLAGPVVEAVTSWSIENLKGCGEGNCDDDWGHTCARLADGRLRCWGANQSGQLGDGSFLTRFVPGDVREAPAERSGGRSRLGMVWRP